MSGGTISSLNDHLFAALDRLKAEGQTAEQIESEVARAQAVAGLADQVIENSKVALAAARLYADHGDRILPHLPLIGGARK